MQVAMLGGASGLAARGARSKARARPRPPGHLPSTAPGLVCLERCTRHLAIQRDCRFCKRFSKLLQAAAAVWMQVQAQVAATCGAERQEALATAAAHRRHASAVIGTNLEVDELQRDDMT